MQWERHGSIKRDPAHIPALRHGKYILRIRALAPESINSNRLLQPAKAQLPSRVAEGVFSGLASFGESLQGIRESFRRLATTLNEEK
jgi:hypothetical protein